MSSCAILFAKLPEPGRVKTRLQSRCSPEEAAAVCRAFVLDSAALLDQCAAETKVVAYAPADAGDAMRDLIGGDDFAWVPQPELDLGLRMAALTEWSFECGSQRTVVIGSDSPDLPLSHLDGALALLHENQVVLAPSTDGGYCLIGLSEPCAELFEGIDWSSSRVLEQTLGRLEGRSLGVLPPWYDVDTPPEAAFLRLHLEALSRAGECRAPHSLRVLRGLDLPPPS